MAAADRAVLRRRIVLALRAGAGRALRAARRGAVHEPPRFLDDAARQQPRLSRPRAAGPGARGGELPRRRSRRLVRGRARGGDRQQVPRAPRGARRARGAGAGRHRLGLRLPGHGAGQPAAVLRSPHPEPPPEPRGARVPQGRLRGQLRRAVGAVRGSRSHADALRLPRTRRGRRRAAAPAAPRVPRGSDPARRLARGRGLGADRALALRALAGRQAARAVPRPAGFARRACRGAEPAARLRLDRRRLAAAARLDGLDDPVRPAAPLRRGARVHRLGARRVQAPRRPRRRRARDPVRAPHGRPRRPRIRRPARHGRTPRHPRDRPARVDREPWRARRGRPLPPRHPLDAARPPVGRRGDPRLAAPPPGGVRRSGAA